MEPGLDPRFLERVAAAVAQVGLPASGPGGSPQGPVWACSCGKTGSQNNWASRLNCRACQKVRPAELQNALGSAGGGPAGASLPWLLWHSNWTILAMSSPRPRKHPIRLEAKELAVGLARAGGAGTLEQRGVSQTGYG